MATTSVNWQEAVLGPLFSLRKNAAITYRAHFADEENSRTGWFGVAGWFRFSSGKADMQQFYAKTWQRLYDDATSVRDAALERPSNYKSLEEFDQAVNALRERAKKMETPSPSAASIAKVTKDINENWFRADADAHNAFGWDRSHVPTGPSL